MDTDQFSGTNSTVLQNLDLGIAEYTNGNFLSRDTLFKDFELPSTSGLDLNAPIVEPHGSEWRRYFSKNTTEGQPVTRFVAEGMLWQSLAAARNAAPPSGGWTMDDRVQEEYAKLLLPRAVGYSAGLLDYFFRGRLKGDLLRVEGSLAAFSSPPYTVQLRLTNDSEEDMQGDFSLYADAPDGTRTQLAGPPNGEWIQQTLVSGTTRTFSFIVPDGFGIVEQFIVVFRGRLGAEDGAVVGKVVGPAKFLEKWDQGLSGTHPWAHSTETPILGTNPNNGVSTIEVVNGQLIMSNNRVAGSGNARFNQSSVGPRVNNGVLIRNFQDVLPLPVTSRTNIQVKFTSSINQQPVCGSQGSCAWQVLEFGFSNQRYVQISVPGHATNTRVGWSGAFIEVKPGAPVTVNIHDVFDQVGIPTDNLVLGEILLLQQLFDYSEPPNNIFTQDPLPRLQRMEVDYIRVSDEANTDPNIDPDQDPDIDGDGLPDGVSVPVVTLTSPAPGASVLEGGVIALSATTSDDGRVASVEFSIDGAVQFIDTSPPFGTQFQIPVGVDHLTVQATAIDIFGRTTVDARTIAVQPDPPPSVVILSPPAGTTVVEKERLIISAQATDNVGVARLVWTINGIDHSPLFSPPYDKSVLVPTGATSLIIEAAATDNLGRTSTATRTLSVISDPGTTVIGRVVDSNGQPFASAIISIFGKLTALSQADGSFLIPGAPTVGPLSAVAAALEGGETLQGVSASVSPIRGGVTDVGDIFMRAIELYPGRKRVVGDAPWSVAVIDLNADGKPDLVTANSESDDISVLLGNGDATFQPEIRFPAGGFPISIAAGDLNKDGKPDVVTANGSGSSNDVSVFLGIGDGTFHPQRRFGAGDFPVAVAVADLNGDGSPDIVAANEGSNDVSVLLGVGDGNLQFQQRFAVGSFPQSVAVADLNGDGFLDIVAANDSTEVSVLFGNGDGTFQAQQTVGVGGFPYSLMVTDLNGDGFADIVTANGNSDDVTTLLGNGDGTFQNEQHFAVGSFPQFVAVADLNADGFADLVTTNGFSNDISVLLSNGDGTFQVQQRFAAGSFPVSATLADLNGDNLLDIVTANLDSDDVSILIGNGAGMFQGPQPQPLYAGVLPSFISAADPNGDGQPDIVTANGFHDSVSVLLGIGDGTLKSSRSFSAGSFPLSVTAADLNGDGLSDIIAANYGSSDVSILLSTGEEDGAAAFNSQQRFAVGEFPGSVAVADLNGDGLIDVVTANEGSNDVSMLLGNGDGTFQSQQRIAVGDAPYSVALGDMNGDGFVDIVTANINSDDVSVVLSNGNGTFQSDRRFPVGNFPGSVAIADLNRDGYLDIVTANESNDVSVLLGNGNGTFQGQQRFSSGDLPYVAKVGDLNGDGFVDIVTANIDSDDVSVLLGNGDGTFHAPRAFAAGIDPVSLTVVDLNGDGRLDLVVGNGSDLFGGVSVLLHQ